MSAPVVADLNPKSLDNAKQQFAEVYGSALAWNAYLKVALFLALLLVLGLIGLNLWTHAKYADVRPLVIRVDEVGRAEAVPYDAASYHPAVAETRYFLTQFVVKHFSRIRVTVHRDYPESLLFLGPGLPTATSGQDQESIEAFVANPVAEEIDVVVNPVRVRRVCGGICHVRVDAIGRHGARQRPGIRRLAHHPSWHVRAAVSGTT